MTIQEVAALIDGTVQTKTVDTSREVTCGYTCDLLSWVMAKGREGMAWATVQAHMNVVAVAVLGLFLAFIYFGLRVAMNCPDRFGSLLAAGITLMIGIQAFMNVAVVIGLMPTTGLPLPFFSAGGTSVSIFMGAVGILLNISRYTNC